MSQRSPPGLRIGSQCGKVSGYSGTNILAKYGKQHYIERFPNQLEALYKGRQGYIYLLDSTDGLTHGKGHSWESKHDVPISQCESIADVYSEILREESLGNIIIHRYAEIDPAEQKKHANYIRDHLTDEGEEMAKFYCTHFSALWD